MKDDVRKYIYGAVIVFLVGVLAWVIYIMAASCGTALNCSRGELAVERTPIPTLLPATMPAAGLENTAGASDECRVAAVDLIGAWVAAGSSETEAFQFTDVNGQNCQSSFAEVLPLFIESNLWSRGSASCVSCHSTDVTKSSAQLSLLTYADIMSGSRRADAESKGTDILGGGKWDGSLLYDFMATSKDGVSGHTQAVSGLVIFAGEPLAEEAASTP
jgi:hypothetical protein